MAARKALFDKKQIALTRAKMRAWWNGDEFDEEAAVAAFEAAQSAPEAANTNAAESDLFDEPPFDVPPRLQALSKLWGEGRLRPGDATGEALEPARIGLTAESVLAFLGPGLVGPVEAVASTHPGKIEVFEWRDEALTTLKHGIAKAKLADRVTVTRVDLEAHVWPVGAYDGVLSVDDFAYCNYPPHLAGQMMKLLKPGACAVVECYAGLPSAELATAFASSFAEPQVKAHGDLLQVFKDVGLGLEADEDLTDEFLASAREGFRTLGEALAEAGKIDPATARELAWEAEAWRKRLQMLSQRRLERRRFVLRKPAEEIASVQSENANAPAG
jgi:hypothetical protein